MTVRECSIALATIEQLPEIPKIEQAAASVFTTADLPLHLRYRVTDSDTLRRAMRQRRLWVAADAAGRTVGFALAEVADGQAYLSEIAVHPDCARQGIGSRLVGAVVDWASAQGFDRVLLVTFSHLPWNAPFYGKLGFVELPAQEIGAEIAGFMEEEKQAGINVDNRTVMALDLRHKSSRWTNSP